MSVWGFTPQIEPLLKVRYFSLTFQYKAPFATIREYQIEGYNQVSADDLRYEQFSTMLQQNDIIVDAAEVHGILTGMLCGGMNLDDQEWIQALSDVIHQGDSLAPVCLQHITDMYNKLCQELIEADFALVMCLPDDSSPINDRGAALVNWVQGFLLGFGLHQADLTACSDEVKEALDDFTQIVKLDEKMDETEQAEQDFFEVVEYVRVSAMICFNELGKSLIDSRQQSPVMH